MEDAADHGVAAVIMVLSTCEAEAILKKSGLSVVDLFRPFGDVEDINGNGHAHPPPPPPHPPRHVPVLQLRYKRWVSPTSCASFVCALCTSRR